MVKAHELIANGGHHIVIGAPGGGKTAFSLTTWQAATERFGSDSTLLLSPTRQSAAHLRQQLTSRVTSHGVHTLGQTPVRTAASLAFAIIRLTAAHHQIPAPTLISGPQQDQILEELLEGHLEDGGKHIAWPIGFTPQMVRLPAFRAQLRDLLMRAAEAGVSGAALTAFGQQHQRPAWEFAGQILEEYTAVTVLAELTPDRGPRFDPATIVDQAIVAWGQLPPEARPQWDVIIHDDYQDATLATARLLQELSSSGSQIIMVGNPDQTVQGFRGGLPWLIERASRAAGSEPGAFGAAVHVLDQPPRYSPALHHVLERLYPQLPPLIGHHRRLIAPAKPEEKTPVPQVLIAASQADEAALIAHHIRSLHLIHQVEWSQIAVVVRSGATLGYLRREFLNAGIPAAASASDIPLRQEASVWPILLLMKHASEHHFFDHPAQLPPETALALLQSAYGGIDAADLRIARRHLKRAGFRAENLAEPAGAGRSGEGTDSGEFTPGSDGANVDGNKSADPVAYLNHLLTGGAKIRMPQRLAEAFKRVAAMTSRALEVVGKHPRETEQVLWEIWQSAQVAEAWQERALAGGAQSERYHAMLDAMMALFESAEQFTDRTPGASITAFVEYIDQQDFPADSLADQAIRSDVVSLHTPASAAGLSWPHVIVAGVQEDSWPDLRVRDTVFGAVEFSDTVLGRGSEESISPAERFLAARQNIAHDELRSFVSALTRSSGDLLITAVHNSEARPSVYLQYFLGTEELPEPQRAGTPLDLRGVIAQLRRYRGGEQAAWAQELLTTLAHAGVEAAAADAWLVGREPTTMDPLFDHTALTISPSDVELIDTCPLRWVLTRHGGRPTDSQAQSVGNLLHDIAADYPRGAESELLEALDARWHTLELPEDSWLTTRTRQEAEDMLRGYAEYVAEHPYRVSTEVPFRVMFEDIVLAGRVDRVEYRAGGIHIVDLKTGKSMVSFKDAKRHPQLGVYQVAASLGGFTPLPDDAPASQSLKPSPGMEASDGVEPSDGVGGSDVGQAPGESVTHPVDGASLLYLRKSDKPRQQPGLAEDAEPQWAADLIHRTAEAINQPQFLARIQPQCSSCPVRSSCPLQEEGRMISEGTL